MPGWLQRGRHAGRHVVAVAWRLALCLVLLELTYLGVANLVLGTRILRHFTKTDEILIDYDGAYSVVPGRVVVRNLRVRVEDHNIQFWIVVERGRLDVSLHELASKRIHVLRVDGEQVTYRMRHKLSHVGKEGPRVAAYPPIPGFADPPLFVGPPPPPIPDSEYNLWDVKIEHVTASVKEVWVLEYRYQGAGVARGSFHVRPARNYDVNPATLELFGGKLTLGDATVAEHATLKLGVTVAESDTQKLVGLEPLGRISATARGRLEGTDLRFLDAYLGPHAGLSATGTGGIDIDLRVQDGAVAPGASLVVRCSDAGVGNDDLRLQGVEEWSLEGPKAKGGPFALGFRSERMTLEARGHVGESPYAEHVAVQLGLTSRLSAPLDVVYATLAPARVVAPDLGWVKRAFPDKKSLPALRGRATLTLEGERAGEARLRGRAHLVLAQFALGPPGGSMSSPSNATLASDDLVVERGEEPRLSGSARLHVDRTAALLPLVSPSPFLREVESKLLALGALEASAKFRVGAESRLDGLDARSGVARVRGYLVVREKGPNGAFLLTTPAVNVGIRVTPAGTTTHALVAGDWLEKLSAPRRSDSGKLSRPVD